MRCLHIQLRVVLCCITLFLLSAVSLKADDSAYVGYGGGAFGTIDLNTGTVTALGSLGQTPAGLGVFDGSLYAASYNSNGTLYLVNPTNGSLTAIGNSGIDYTGGFGSTTSGLYAVGNGGADLYSINPLTGAATLIGATGLSDAGWRDISTNSSILYFGNGPNLYTLNTSTGAATLVGTYGSGAEIGALVTVDGTLYGGDQGNGTIDTVDTSTGAATVTGASANNIWGLAPASVPAGPTVPEPGTVTLLGSGLLGLVGLMRRKMVKNV